MVQMTSPLGAEPAAGQQGALFRKIQELQAELESVGTSRCKHHVITRDGREQVVFFPQNLTFLFAQI